VPLGGPQRGDPNCGPSTVILPGEPQGRTALVTHFNQLFELLALALFFASGGRLTLGRVEGEHRSPGGAQLLAHEGSSSVSAATKASTFWTSCSALMPMLPIGFAIATGEGIPHDTTRAGTEHGCGYRQAAGSDSCAGAGGPTLLDHCRQWDVGAQHLQRRAVPTRGPRNLGIMRRFPKCSHALGSTLHAQTSGMLRSASMFSG
jgi:hypothetical protein